MTLSLFQKYELRKVRFNPGSIWRAKAGYTVQELEILPKDTPDVVVYDDADEMDFSGKNLVPFLIIESSSSHPSWGGVSRLNRGRKLSWSERYMEQNYELVSE
jgi:hypothetical protein